MNLYVIAKRDQICYSLSIFPIKRIAKKLKQQIHKQMQGTLAEVDL